MYLTLFLLILLTSYPMCLSLVTASALKSAISTAVSLFTPMRVIHNGSHPVWFNSTNSLPTLDDIDFDVSEVFRILASLDTSKAMGIDGIGPLVLKSCADVLCVPIHHLFTVSLSNGYLPSEWRIHLITPIFKSGDKSSIRNYRPIIRIIIGRVSDFVADSISTSQFGFMKGRSSQQQLLVMLNEIFSNKNSKTCSDIVYLDISKAFDSVSHFLNFNSWVYLVLF